METYSKAQRLIFWIHHSLYLGALLSVGVLLIALSKTPFVLSLGIGVLLLTFSEFFRVVSVWTSVFSKDERKKASAFTRLISFDTLIPFIIGLLYINRYFLLEDNSFFYMAGMFLGLMLIILSFFRGNGWTKRDEMSLLSKFRIGGLVLLFILSAFGSLHLSIVTNDFENGYRAYMFIPFFSIAISFFLIRFFEAKWPKVSYLWLLIEASFLVWSSMALCFAF